MIQLEKINKFFGEQHVLRDISLQVDDGTIHGIIGENGAGKSTLMKILTGFLTRSSGSISIDRRHCKLANPAEARKLGIGMLYQEPLDFPQLSVLENFMGGATTFAPKLERQRLEELCSQFNFQLDSSLSLEQLTVGERQQLELLRLIRNNVRVLILDEPTTGISEKQRRQLFASLRQLRDQGKAIILVSHKLEEIEELCDSVSVLRRGQLVLQQTAPFDRNILLEAMFEQIPETFSNGLETVRGPAVLSFSAVQCDAGRAGLHNVSTTIHQGEIVGLAGVDGSGQSLFLKLAAGLIPPTSGTVQRFGKELAGTGRYDSRIAFLPADRMGEGLFPAMTIREHHILGNPGGLLVSRNTGRLIAEQAIGRFSIHGTPESSASSLSGGNQQRLLLSLVREEVQLLLLENPTRGLDVRSAQWTWEFLHARTSGGGTLIFASPDLDELLCQSNRLLVFYEGRIILDRATNECTHEQVARAITGEVV